MKQGLFLLIASAGMQSALAAPASSLKERGYGTSCTFNDANKVKTGKAGCSTIILDNIAVPAGQTLDLTGLQTGTQVIFQGQTTFGYKEWEGPLVSVSGTKINVSGASGSVLNGDGARWWDGKGDNGKVKPKFFAAHKMFQSTITNIYVKNSPVQVFSVNGVDDLTMTGCVVDNKDGDTQGGHNTDAFDVGASNNVKIINARVANQDDCLAINSGTNILFQGGICSGGHGLSIGSLGGGNEVNGVTIHKNTIMNSDNGIRIKTKAGETGAVTNVVYSNIHLQNIRKFGIVIEQDYKNGKTTGVPTNGVKISNVSIKDVSGSVADSAVDRLILCGSGSCTNFNFNNVTVSGGKKSTKCLNLATAGVTC